MNSLRKYRCIPTLIKWTPIPDAVVMMTVHSAKGLEFNNVFAIGMEDGIFPSGRCLNSDSEIEEERRLAYVAITRARKRLYLSSAAQRMLFWNHAAEYNLQIYQRNR